MLLIRLTLVNAVMNLQQEGKAAASVAALSGPEPLPLNARQVPDKAGYAQMPTWACTRPEATASASAVWSRSVWSA